MTLCLVGLALRFRRFFGAGRGISRAPAMFFAAWTVTGEIAPARRTTVGSGAATEHNDGPARRVIVLFAPGRQILAITSGTTGELPCSRSPHAGAPSCAATTATKRVNSKKRANFLGEILLLRNPDVARSAFWTGKLHLPRSRVMTASLKYKPKCHDSKSIYRTFSTSRILAEM